MENYIFNCSDIEACSEYISATLICSPEKCKLVSMSEDKVILYETEIFPLISGNFETTLEINCWRHFEDHPIVYVSPGTLNFNNKIRLNCKPSDPVESRLPQDCVIISKIPEYISNYNGMVKIIKFKKLNEVTMSLDNGDVTLVMDTKFITPGSCFRVEVQAAFLHDFVSDNYLKIYLENDYPICIEDGHNRTFIAPCSN